MALAYSQAPLGLCQVIINELSSPLVLGSLNIIAAGPVHLLLHASKRKAIFLVSLHSVLSGRILPVSPSLQPWISKLMGASVYLDELWCLEGFEWGRINLRERAL